MKPSSYVDGSGNTVTFPAKVSENMSTVVAALAAPGAGKHIYVTGVIFSNNTGAAITMVLQEDTAGTPADIFPDLNIPINSTVAITFPHAIKCTANKNLGAKSSDADAGNVAIIFGYVDRSS
jgi:hypothetical protein